MGLLPSGLSRMETVSLAADLDLHNLGRKWLIYYAYRAHHGEDDKQRRR